MSNEPTVQQLFDLSGKTALISGASGYLGGTFSRACVCFYFERKSEGEFTSSPGAWAPECG